MIDREKVINAIECCIDGCLCAECDYEGIEGCWNKVLLTDALALLKDQEPVEPELEGGGSSWWHVCGECHGAIDASDRYCKHCGRRIKHEEKAE